MDNYENFCDMCARLNPEREHKKMRGEVLMICV